MRGRRRFVPAFVVVTVAVAVAVPAVAGTATAGESQPASAASDATTPNPVLATGANQAAASAASLPALTDGEVPALRTAHSSTFRTAAGDYRTELTPGLVNYQDSAGAWQKIDPTLTKTSAGAYATTSTPASVTLPASLPDGVSVGTAAGTVHFSLNGAATVTPTVSGTTATYVGALPGVDVSYDSGNSALKENLVLASASAPSTFSFTLTTTNGLRLSASGNSVAVTTAGGAQVFGLAAPTVVDSSHTWSGDTSGKVALAVTPVAGQANTWTVTEAIASTWLASPARVFPVTVDPVVTFGASSAEQGCWYASDSPTANHCGDSAYIVGHGGAPGTGGAGRILLEFPDLTTSIPKDAVVTDSDLSLFELSTEDSTAVPAEVVPVTQQWTTSATYNTYDGTHNWATAGGDYASTPAWIDTNIAGHNGNRVDFYPTAMVQNWVNQSQANDGLLLKGMGTELSIDNYLTFTSWNTGTTSQWPKLTVDWDRNYSGGSEVSYPLSDHLSLNVDPAGGNGQILQTGSSYSAPGIGFGPSWAYNSTRPASSSLGNGWNSNTAGDIELVPNGGGAKLIGAFANPAFFALQQNSDGTPATDVHGNTLYTTPPSINADLTSKADVAHGGTIYTLTFHADAEVWTFHSIPTCPVLTPDQSCTILGSQVDRNGSGLTFNYDSAHTSLDGTYPPTSATDAAGRVFTFGEQSSSPYMTTNITDPSSRSWSFTHSTDGNNRITVVTDPTGAQTSYGYDSSGRINSITTAHNAATGGSVAVTTIGYDSSNRVSSVTRVTNPTAAPGSWVGLTTTFTYNAYALVMGNWQATTAVKDPRLNTTTYYYDVHDNVVEVLDADGYNRQTTYNANGDPLQLSDKLTAATNLTYDSKYNLQKIQAPDIVTGGTPGTGRFATLQYTDPAHPYQPSSSTDPENNTTAYHYDTAGNLQSLQPNSGGSPAGPTLTDAYQGDGSTTCGGKTGELCSTTDALGHVTTYAYDTSGNPTTITPPAPLGATTNTFDSLGRLTSTTDGDGNKTTYGYDADDRITSLELGGHTTCTSGDISAGNCISYAYDGDGNVTTRKDSTGTTTYSYDVLNRVTSKAIPGISTPSSVTYDAANNVATYTDAGGTVTYGYDPANLLTSLAEPGGSCTSTPTVRCTTFMNDKNGNRTQTIYPSGEKIIVGYDTSGRETSVSAYRPMASTTFYSESLDYLTGSGADSDLIQSMTVNGSSLGQLSYDAYDRLSRTFNGVTAENFNYDADGNLTSHTVSGRIGGSYFGYNNADELCWSGGTTGSNGTTTCPTTPSGDYSYTYDGVGNQLTNGFDGTSSTYNNKNQTSSVTLGTTTTTFGYADLDQSERVSSASGGTTTGIANGLFGISTTQAGSGSPLYFTRDPEGNLISLRVGAGGSSSNSYYLQDYQDTVLYLTDSTGTTDTANYLSGGTAGSGSLATANPFRNTGGYYDSTTGLLKLGVRYYDQAAPIGGRFTQRDTLNLGIADPGAVDKYVYADDDSINETDPTGQLGTKCTGSGRSTKCVDLDCHYYHTCTSGNPLKCARDLGGDLLGDIGIGVSLLGEPVTGGASTVGFVASAGAEGTALEATPDDC